MAPGENEFDIPALGCIEKTKTSSSIPILLSYLPLKIPGRLCKGLVSVGKSSPGDSDMGHKQGWKIRSQAQGILGLTQEYIECNKNSNILCYVVWGRYVEKALESHMKEWFILHREEKGHKKV